MRIPPESGVMWNRVGLALAAYVRSLTPPRSPFHDFQAGDAGAIPKEARDGFALFHGEQYRCSGCHPLPGFTDGQLHQLPIASHQDAEERIPTGGYRARDRQTLTLWDVARTGPYFRSGEAATLEEALALHLRDLRREEVTESETAALLAFLRSLSP